MSSLFEKFVDEPLNALDRGVFFRDGYYYMTLLIAVGVVLGGVYSIFSPAFGDQASMYIDWLIEQDGLTMLTNLAASVLTAIISLIMVVVVAAILVKRARDMRTRPYTSLIGFTSREVVPHTIKAYGEIAAVLSVTLGLYGLVGALLAADPLTPLRRAMVRVYEPIYLGDFGTALGRGSGAVDEFGEYLNAVLTTGVGGLLISVLVAFAALVVCYVFLQFYRYCVVLVTNLVGYMPRFAIPLWVQKSERARD